MSKNIKDYIAESEGWKLDSEKAWDAWEELKERLGNDAGDVLAQTLSYDALAESLIYIFRQYDFSDSPNIEKEFEDSKTKDKADVDKLIKEEKEAVESYQNEIDNSNSDKETKVLKHIQNEEKEHKEELENIKDDDVVITRIPQEVIKRQNAKTELVTDFVYDLLKENNIKDFTLESSEYPYIYVDILNEEDMKKAEKILNPHFKKLDTVDDEGFYFITLKSIDFLG